MIFLDIAIEEFLAKFPEFKNGMQRTCEEYNLDIKLAKPFMTKEKIGILLSPEGAPPITIHVFRDDEINKEANRFFKNNLL